MEDNVFEELVQFPLQRLVDDLPLVIFEQVSAIYLDDVRKSLTFQLVLLSPHSLASCTGVCHRFYRLAVSVLYRSETRVVNCAWHNSTKRLLRAHSRLPVFARKCTLDDRNENESDDALPLV